MNRLPAFSLSFFLALSSIFSLAQKPQILPPPEKPTAAPVEPAKAAEPEQPQLTRADLEAFLDGFVPIQLQRDDIAGAVVVVVKDGQVLLAKGYGYSDRKTRKPVSADATLFRPGSISKTFTWTAVMQLVEQGKIDLNRDINDYLDFKIPATFGKPITMKDLMTHTPGFEETIKDLFVEHAADMTPLRQYLDTHLPKEIFPPGTTPAYSNYGAALAGYIVQRVSGMPFDDYIEKNIFQPLGMQHSTFRQPLPADLKPLMSEGYNKASEPAKSFEYVQAWPAGSLSTTGDDMSRYMIAHLQNGQFNGNQILKPETAKLMHSRAFGLDPELNGMAYGFYEESRNGHRIIGHGGDTQWFHSDMHLMLDDNLGFFISFNSAGKGNFAARTALWQHFLDRYFPYTPPAAQTPATASADAKALLGTWWLSRRSQTNIAAIVSAFAQDTLTGNADGTISLSSAKDYAGNPKRLQEIAPMLFRDVNGQGHLALQHDYAGRPILLTDLPIFVYQRVPGYKNAKLNFIVLCCSLAVFLLTLLFWPVNALLRTHYGYHAELNAQYRKNRMLMRLICLVNLLCVASLAMWLTTADENIAMLGSHFDVRLHLIQLLGALGVLGAFFSIYYFASSWKNWSLWGMTKLWNTLLMLACVGYALFLLNWHVLNYSLNY